MVRQEVPEDVVASDFAQEGSGAGDGEADPDSPDESDDEEDNLVATEGREAEDDEDDDGDDPRRRELDDRLLVRFELVNDLVTEDGEEDDGDDEDDADEPPDCEGRIGRAGVQGSLPSARLSSSHHHENHAPQYLRFSEDRAVFLQSWVLTNCQISRPASLASAHSRRIQFAAPISAVTVAV